MRPAQADERTQYLESLFPFQNNSFLIQAHEASQKESVVGISMSYPEMKIISNILRWQACQKIVEIGTLNGFSALSFLESLEQGAELWSFEKESARADFSQRLLHSFATAKGQIAHVIKGDAEKNLVQIEDCGPFDAIFIDGNKSAYGKYLDWSEQHIKKGGFILLDNVFLSGAVYLDPSSEDFKNSKANRFSSKQIEVMKGVNLRLADDALYESFLVPTEEGLFVARKKF